MGELAEKKLREGICLERISSLKTGDEKHHQTGDLKFEMKEKMVVRGNHHPFLLGFLLK